MIKRQSKCYLEHLKTQTLKKKLKIITYNLKHNEIFSPHPINAKIEINGSCNLDCIMCLRKSLPNRNKIMSKDQFISILDNINSLVEWSPHGYNEPLLHPEFFDFVKETNTRNISLYLVTNGTILKKKKAKELLDLNPRIIRVSIDAIGNRYEEIRKGSNWINLKENLINLSKMEKNDTIIQLYSTIWKDNINEIRRLIEFAEELNFPIKFSDITFKNEFGESKKNNSIRETFSKDKIQLIKESYPTVKIDIEKPIKRNCTLPWSSLYIDVIGDIYPCTDTLKYKMGNIFEKSIKEIYNSIIYKEFRFNSLRGINYECKNCLAWSPIKNIPIVPGFIYPKMEIMEKLL